MRRDVHIRLAPAAEQIGLALMLKDLLEQNLEQNPHKIRPFKKLNMEIGLKVDDADVSLTMAFSHGTLTIRPGIGVRPGLLITAEADVVMALSNVRIRWGFPYYFDEEGREVLKAMQSGRIKIRGMLIHFLSLIRLSNVMSVRTA